MTFDPKAHDDHFGVTEDRKKPGGSNAGECKEKQAMTFEKKTMPKAALHFMDHECFAQAKAVDENQDELLMVAYSGGVIPKHWFWGDLAIDLNGMSFPKERYPILENHDTQKKIGFADSMEVDGGALVVRNATFVDTPESNEFRRLSKDGFPFQSSIYASPSVIEKIPDGKESEVNGMAVQGPATIWWESTFKEASVCVFGYDSNTKSAAFASDEVEVALNEIVNAPESDPKEPQHKKEVKGMDFEQFSKEHPELLKEIVDNTTEDLKAQFSKEKKELEEKLAQERNGFSEERTQFEEKVAALEKAEAIRRERELKFEAGAIWREKLSNSDIPDRLHDKVMSQVNYEKFVNEGALDTESFQSAIDEEIKDWTDRGVTSNVMGFGVSVKTVDEDARKKKDEGSEDSLADQLFALSGGDRREVS